MQILLGEREHGDSREIDFLRARQRQQKIERSLEAFDVDHQGLAGIERFAAFVLPQRRVVACAGLVVALALIVVRQSSCELHTVRGRSNRDLGHLGDKGERRSASKGSGSRKNARARSKRSSASPASGGTALATCSISAKSPLQCSATSQPASITADARSANGPRKRFHAEVVAHHQAFESDQISNHFTHYNGGYGGGSKVIEGLAARHGRSWPEARRLGPETAENPRLPAPLARPSIRGKSR